MENLSNAMARCELTIIRPYLPPSQKPNLPVPRELRDQIYSYLLVGENVKNGKNYRFHTNILAVNHAIRDETEELLYKRNIFVVVSHQFARIEETFGGLTWISLVTDTKASRMKQHSLRIHVCLRMSRFTIDGTSAPEARDLNPPMQSCLVLAQDLPTLCYVFAYQINQHPGPAVYIYSRQEDRLTCDIPTWMWEGRSASVKLELRSTRRLPMNADLQYTLLRPCGSIINDGLRVSITGDIVDADDVSNCRQLMGPLLLWVSAKKWCLTDILLHLKAVADEKVRQDRYAEAERHYEDIKTAAIEGLSGNHVAYPDSAQRQSDWVSAMSCILLDCALSVAWLSLRNQMITITEENIKLALMLCKESSPLHSAIPVATYTALTHTMLITGLHLGVDGPLKVPLKDASVRAVVDYIRVNVSPLDQHFLFDLALLEDVDDKSKILSQEHMPLDKVSVSQFQPRVLDSYSSSVPRRPEAFVGFHDTDHLSTLSKADKEAINGMQKGYGLKVHKFS